MAQIKTEAATAANGNTIDNFARTGTRDKSYQHRHYNISHIAQTK